MEVQKRTTVTGIVDNTMLRQHELDEGHFHLKIFDLVVLYSFNEWAEGRIRAA